MQGTGGSAQHPSDATVAAFLDGTLETQDRRDLLIHIDGCEDCRLLLADAVVAATGGRPMFEELEAGALVAGRYRVEQALGRGGFGAVYVAKDEKLGRKVALKILVRTDEKEARLRFMREARVLAEIEHPNVVRVLDVSDGAGVGDVPFLVLELLEGETLATRLAREKTLPLDLVVRFTREVLAGLAAAHARGIVHRDLKPSNVFLVGAPQPSVRILDFGIAKLLQSDDRLRTETGAMLGTPAYMAPEQLLGAPVDPRTDVHAVGALVFEMVTGRKAFIGDRIALVTAILVADRPRIDTLRTETPPELAAFVARALHRRAEARFSSAGSMLAALSSLEEKPRAPFGLRRIFFTSLLSVVALGLIAGAIASWPKSHVPGVPTLDATVTRTDDDASAPVASFSPSPVLPPASVTGANTTTLPSAPGPSCYCHYNIGSRYYNALCSKPQVPRCGCTAPGSVVLCVDPPSADASSCRSYAAFGGEGKKSGGACRGYAFVWPKGRSQHEAPNGELMDGVLDCNVCYETLKMPGVHGTKCRGLDGSGEMQDGIMLCDNKK